MKYSLAGRRFISNKIKRLYMKEGKPLRQSIAIALNTARDKGFKVPKWIKKKVI